MRAPHQRPKMAEYVNHNKYLRSFLNIERNNTSKKIVSTRIIPSILVHANRYEFVRVGFFDVFGDDFDDFS